MTKTEGILLLSHLFVFIFSVNIFILVIINNTWQWHNSENSALAIQ